MAYNKGVTSLPKISAPGWTEDQTERLLSAHKKLLRYAKKFPNKECAYTLRYPDMLLDEHIIVGDESVTIPDREYPYIGIHNHPTNTIFSHSDMANFARRDNMAGLTAVGNNGTVYITFKTADYDRAGFAEFVYEMAKRLNKFTESEDVKGYLRTMNLMMEEAGKYGVYYDTREN